MKSIIKFMTVALAAGMVVSCSDDLGLEKNTALNVEKGDLVGTLYSDVPTRVAILDQMTLTQDGWGYPAVWSDDDKVNVFSAKRLNFNQYTLKEGAGTNKAVFEPITEDPELLAATDLYAITEADYQFQVSATKENNGKIKVSAKIPESFDLEQLATADAYKLPSPYWGAASFGSNGELNVNFRPLTALLRLDLDLLPEGVNGLVVVSGNNTAYNEGVCTFYKKNAQGKFDESAATKSTFDGSSEGLSGWYSAELDYQSAESPGLSNDEPLLCYDTLRVDFPEATMYDENKVVFIPLIANHYDNLKIIAVQKDYPEWYTWGGEILREFNDFFVVNGQTYDLMQTAEQTITKSKPSEISAEIAKMIDGRHSLIVSVPNIEPVDADSVIYICSDTEVGNTSVTINFPSTLTKGLAIVEASAGDHVGHHFTGWVEKSIKQNDYTKSLFDAANNYKGVESGDPARQVTLNFNGAIANPSSISITLPTSNVLLTSKAEIDMVNVLASNLNNVSGYDTDMNGAVMSNQQNAALKFKGHYGTVNYYSGGAQYFFDEESEISKSFNIYGKNPASMRITDAMVKQITYPTLGDNPTAYIFTTGSAAIGELKEDGNKVKIKAYWTGKRLTPVAVQNGYEGTAVKDTYYGVAEKGAIYTAAQLQGMGLSAGYEGVTPVYAYTISPKVESIHLGGIVWPWIGAEIEQMTTPTSSSALPTANGQKIADKFSLDGRNVELKNMVLDIYDPNIEVPGCCGTTNRIRVTKNLGLIRSILTSDKTKNDEKTAAVDLYNIQLNDVLINTGKYAIDNIGSLVGIIDSEGDVKIGGRKDGVTTSDFTDIRIKSKGNNIGGVVGELECAANVIIDKVKVESIEANNTYIHGGHIEGRNNVGGIVGRVTYDECYKGSAPQFGNIKYKYTTPLGKQKLTKGSDNTNFFVTSKLGPIQKNTKADGTGDVMNSAANFYTRTRQVADDGTITYKYTNQEEVADFPKAGTNYFYLSNDGTQIVEAGTVTNGTDDRLKLTGSWNGYDGDGKAKSKTVSFPAGDPATYTGVLIADETAEGGYRAYNLDEFNPDLDYYYDVTDVFKEEVASEVDNDYPTGLTFSNATVTLTPTSTEGGPGIILGENGNNVGGLAGATLTNGGVKAFNAIAVTVPTIQATTKEDDITCVTVLVKNTFGNNVGGLIGEFTNLSDATASDFAGTIKCATAISADALNAGGVLGIQRVAKPTETGIHEDYQVSIGLQDKVTVEVGTLHAQDGWVGGLVGNQASGCLYIDGNKKGFDVNIKTALTGANCVGGLIGENFDVAVIDNQGTNKVTINSVAITQPAEFYTFTDAGLPNQAGSLYLGTVGTVVGKKNGTLIINGTKNLTVSPDTDGNGFSVAQKNELLFGLHGSAATTEIAPNTKKYWGDSNHGYVGYASMTGNYQVDGTVASTQQGNYKFNIEMEY